MKKKLIILSLVVLTAVGVGGFFYFSDNPQLPFPLLSREKTKFSLKKELSKAGINLNQRLVWDEELMSFRGVTDQGIRVIFSEEFKASDQISSLQLILKKSKMITNGNGKIKVIDLRTLDPYVSIQDN